jgi:hypothetical protein
MQVAGDDLVPERIIVALERVGACDPGTVHQRIELSQASEHRTHGGGVSDVARQETVRAISRRSPRQHQNIPAVGRQPIRHGPTDPARAAGDHSLPGSHLVHCAVPPPSTGNTTPVMNEAASEARNATTDAISAGAAKRPSGTPDL